MIIFKNLNITNFIWDTITLNKTESNSIYTKTVKVIHQSFAYHLISMKRFHKQIL
jgi:hypothetical protein